MAPSRKGAAPNTTSPVVAGAGGLRGLSRDRKAAGPVYRLGLPPPFPLPPPPFDVACTRTVALAVATPELI